MTRILLEELERAFRNPRFLIVTVIALMCFAIGSYRLWWLSTPSSDPLNPVNRLMLYLNFGEFTFMAAFLAALPFADSFLIDRDQGFLRLIVQRVPYRRYLVAKILTVAIAGGVSLLLSLAAIFLIGLSAPTDWQTLNYYSTSSLNTGVPWGPFGWLYTLNPFYYLFYLLVSAFAFGAAYALLGLAVSTFVSNRYVVLAAPLVLVQVLSFLEERFASLTHAFNPLYSLMPFETYESFLPGEQLAQYVLMIGLSLACVLFFARKTRAIL